MKTIDELKAAIAKQAEGLDAAEDRAQLIFSDRDLVEEYAAALGIKEESKEWQDLRDYQRGVVSSDQ